MIIQPLFLDKLCNSQRQNTTLSKLQSEKQGETLYKTVTEPAHGLQAKDGLFHGRRRRELRQRTKPGVPAVGHTQLPLPERSYSARSGRVFKAGKVVLVVL